MSKKVSLRDVARHCNVSAMTVSCVVRQVNCVKASTRKKVEKALKELGYQIDPTLRALAAYRTQAVSENSGRYKSTLAFFDSEETQYSKSVFLNCAEAARARGYGLKYFKQPGSPEEQATFSRRLWTQGIRGILLGPARTEFNLEGVQLDRFAVVGMGAFHHSPAIDTVCSDYFQGLYLAAQHCVEKGYKNIGLFLVSYLEARTGHRWLGAYHAFCTHYRKKPKVWIYEDTARPTDKEIFDWIAKNKIDAILTLAQFIPRAGPFPDLRQVYLNDWHVSSSDWCVSAPQDQLARESIILLDHLLIHQKYGIPDWPKQITIQPVFHSP